MSTFKKFSVRWMLQTAGVFALGFVFAVGGLTPVFAEEEAEPAAEEPAPEEPAAEEPAPEEPAGPEGGYILNGEAITPDEHGYVPPPEAFEGLGGWAEVDDITGEVRTVVVGNYSSAAMWEHAKRAMAGKGTSMRFQTRATPDGNVAGWNNATFEKSSGTFRVDSGRAPSK
jgi:hypothetical protein